MDIASLGFKVETSQLEKGEQSLDKVSRAAAGLTRAANRMASVIEGSNASAMNSSMQMARIEEAKTKAILRSLQANQNATKEQLALAQANLRAAQSVMSLVAAENKKIATLNRVVSVNRNVEKSALAAAGAQAKLANARPGNMITSGVSQGRGLAGGIARDQMPNRFNTANIAAQFQDIGVTAQMGMSPMIIALQQGTQLSAIIQSMESPLKGIGVALRSIISPVTLLTIGLVGLVAAGLQMVDWGKVAKTVLNGLADALEVALPYIMGVAAALALLYAPTIIGGLVSLVAAIGGVVSAALIAGAKIAAAWFVAMGPVGWVIAGLALVVAAFEAMGFDILNPLKNIGNTIIGTFVGAFEAIKATWTLFPAIIGGAIIGAANIVRRTVETMINGSIEAINGMIQALPESLRSKIFGEGAGVITWRAKLELDNPYADAAAEAGAKAGAEFKKAFEQDYIGGAIAGAKGLASGVANGIRDFSDGLKFGEDKKGKKSRGKTDAEKFDDIVNGAEQRIAVLKAEQMAIGMSEEATARLKYETELLNDAKQKNIELSPAQRAALGELAAEMARIEEQTRRAREVFDTMKDVTKGFISDLRTSLKNGESMWDSFRSAAVNAIDKIMDKMMEMAIDSAFGGGSSGGGFLSSILGAVFNGISGGFGGFGGGGLSTEPVMQGTGGLYAKGGVFTNGIVSRPTAFQFAAGGQFGVMGEAGPEAIMPLHKGPDGSLGVKMSGGDAANDNNQGEGGNTYVIDARGTDESVVARLEQMLMSLAGPGVVERRVMNAQQRGQM